MGELVAVVFQQGEDVVQLLVLDVVVLLKLADLVLQLMSCICLVLDALLEIVEFSLSKTLLVVDVINQRSQCVGAGRDFANLSSESLDGDENVSSQVNACLVIVLGDELSGEVEGLSSGINFLWGNRARVVDRCEGC